MIRIKPYYDHDDRDKIFNLYLTMVSEAVPFFPEDVGTAVTKQKRDQAKKAEQAEQYVYNFSLKLHEYLYGDENNRYTNGKVDRSHLRRILEMKLPEFCGGTADSEIKQEIETLINEGKESDGHFNDRQLRIQKTIQEIIAERIRPRSKNAAGVETIDSRNSLAKLERDYRTWINEFIIHKNDAGSFCDGYRINKKELPKDFSFKMLIEKALNKKNDVISSKPCIDFEEKLKNDAAETFCGIIDKEAGKVLLDNVFCYDKFSKCEDAYKFASMLGVEVCPYCNRLFITTLLPKATEDESANKKTKPTGGIRPQFDHYKSKSNYPFLALSINNLIPCCGVCNLSKHDKDNPMLYPYEEGMDDDCEFATEPIDGAITKMLQGARIAPDTFEICMRPKETDDAERKKRIEASIQNLRLKDLYQSHKGYVSDLYFQRYIITDELIESIKNQFPSLFETTEEVRIALLLMDTDPEKWGERPLAKLTHDIKKQIDDLYRLAFKLTQQYHQ